MRAVFSNAASLLVVAAGVALICAASSARAALLPRRNGNGSGNQGGLLATPWRAAMAGKLDLAKMSSNATLVADLASPEAKGTSSITLLFNNQTGQYSLAFGTAVQPAAKDTLTSALVLKAGKPVLNITGTNGFVTTTRAWLRYAAGQAKPLLYTGGMFEGLAALSTNGQSYLAIVKDMIANPGGYTAQVLSKKAPNGLVSGIFANKAAKKRPPVLGKGGILRPKKK